MSRAFVAFYMGDYQKKTQHLDTLQHGAYFLLLQHCWTHGALPQEAAGRAAIARLPLAQWKRIAPTINAFFDGEGRNKRATQEVEKAERVSLKRAMAGRQGGFSSGISKSIAKGQQLRSKEVANATDMLKQTGKQKPTNSVPIQNSKLESFLTTAREGVDDTKQTGGSLATAQLESARREPPIDGSLAASLDRAGSAARVGCPPGRPFWVDFGTTDWAAHEHWRRSRAWKPPTTIIRIQDGVELTGNWFEGRVPTGYDEATGERTAPSENEDAA